MLFHIIYYTTLLEWTILGVYIAAVIVLAVLLNDLIKGDD